MFFSDSFTSKNSPLAKVWLAAHVERKLNKTQFLHASIPRSVEAILNDQTAPMSIRLSAQLLVGIVRIYSRKAKYLVDDCNDALLKLKLSFNPARVDMDDGNGHNQHRNNNNAITLPGIDLDFDIGPNSINIINTAAGNGGRKGNRTTAAANDITLPQTSVFDLGFPDQTLDLGLDLAGSEIFGGSTNKMDADLDLGLDLDDSTGFELGIEFDKARNRISLSSNRKRSHTERSVGDSSVELGRDLDNGVGNLSDNNPMIDMYNQDFGIDDAPWDMDMNAGSRTLPPFHDDNGLASMAKDPMATDGVIVSKAAMAKKPRLRKQIVDSITELDSTSTDASILSTSENNILPNSKLYLRLIDLDKIAPRLFLPRLQQDTVFEGPPGLHSSLENVFTLPTRASKRQREQEENHHFDGDQSVEVGRRNDNNVLNSTMMDDFGMDYDNVDTFGGPVVGIPQQDFGIDDSYEGFGAGGPAAFEEEGRLLSTPQKGKSTATRRSPRNSQQTSSSSKRRRMQHEQNGEDENQTPIKSGAGSKLATFDDISSAGKDVQASQQQKQIRPSQTNLSLSQSQSQSFDEGDVHETRLGNKIGPSTLKALNVLNDEMENTWEDDDVEQKRQLSFEKVSHNASKRAASAFFYELLLLGSRNCVNLNQSSDPSDPSKKPITVTSKPGFEDAIERFVNVI